MGRRIFVGDIQGCAAELGDLLTALAFSAEDRLYPVGDVVNRGPDSLGALRILQQTGAQAVLGNHELHLLRAAAGGRVGRRDTFTDVLRAPDSAALLGWIGSWPLVRAWDDVVLVHAGFDPSWIDPVARLTAIPPLAGSRDVQVAVSIRWCQADGTLVDADPPDAGRPPAGTGPYRPWFEFWRGRLDRTVVFGHWAKRGLVVEPGFRGLDTGCVWGGALSAWIAEEDRVVQVPARRPYALIAR